jgi:hypothetical protein
MSMMEIIGAIEMVKHDLLVAFDDAEDDDPEPMDGVCVMPEAA